MQLSYFTEKYLKLITEGPQYTHTHSVLLSNIFFWKKFFYNKESQCFCRHFDSRWLTSLFYKELLIFWHILFLAKENEV